jgi:hypothetical protein
MLLAVWMGIVLLEANQVNGQSSWGAYVPLGLGVVMCLWMAVLGRRALALELKHRNGNHAELAAPADRAGRGGSAPSEGLAGRPGG